MRPRLRFVLLLGALMGAGALAARVPEFLSRVEIFQVTRIRVQGNRFLSEEQAVKAAAVLPGANVWEDHEASRERLASHPLVKEARIRRRPPGTLILQVVEWEPVALVPGPALDPVDEGGRLLPIDPAQHRLDLPILTPWGGGRGAELTQGERRTLAEEVLRMGQTFPELLARLSELSVDRRGDFRAQVSEPEVTLFYRAGLPRRRIQEGLRVLADASGQFEGKTVAEVDLRYEDQVVVRLRRAEGN